MSEIWPLDVWSRRSSAPAEGIRPFKCVLLMPFEGRFDHVADILKQTVSDMVSSFASNFGMEQPIIQRLDWVTSSGVIQQEIWQEIAQADLVFCDITGYNPNVMFEGGVSAAWKDTGGFP